MSDRMRNPRPGREVPRYNGAIPEAQSKQQPRQYDPRQQPKRVVLLRGSWWVWLSIGIGLTVVAGALFGGGGNG
ncbi:MAG: hypothetical protein K0R99_915 [Microbacterium sp.]|jgi:hypothetical protein|nr:hypothetical protein [Microbacterium sp.]